MKRDFDEFSSAVKSEASTLANQTATAVKETLQLDDEDSAANTVKRSVSTFLGQMKEALSPSPSTEFDEALVIHDGNPIAMTKLQVSHTDFWQRYLFRKAVLEDAEAEIERRLDRERKQAENYRWEQGDKYRLIFF
ncbi:hypothetical protein AAG570_007287 [Ranatra chinensis]|uniref:BSD domain-containing protein n=1 Tax=Ranatra chinensis TaxID=642074 RepID=A0ABD0XVG3_9HEMI